VRTVASTGFSSVWVTTYDRSIDRDYRQGLADPDVLALARAESRILIAADRDFGKLAFVHGQSHAGVIFFRLKTRDFPTVCARIVYVLDHYADKLDEFLVVTEHDVRSARPR
jgi:predicted nuclease of predicted toxin-antitoxin system